MIVLDTNVIASLMRREPPVIDWLDGQPSQSVWVTAISVYETRFGIELLATGRRRRQLEESFATLVDREIEDRVLAFDQTAAEQAGRIAARQRSAGRPVEIRDVQIAGIIAAKKATLATRNVRHFEGIGLALINPWSPQPI